MSSACTNRRICAVFAAALVITFGTSPAQQTPQPPGATLDVHPSEGAAPGYVPDTTCATCHRALYDSFQHVGMSQSLKRPQDASRIERFGEEFYHEPSRRYYRIDRGEDDELTFTRFQRDAEGNTINRVELAIEWVLGSGNRARSYLYRSPYGELFMLPISWYSEPAAWRMSPGFEAANHQGLSRKVNRACLFCHNAYPEVAAGSDAFSAPHTFPQTLPEGIGCQRCHGPGAAHVNSVLNGETLEDIHRAIVNPAKLPSDRRDSVCFQCHLLPAESVEGVRVLGRDDYSFRPGERLTDYLVNVDVTARYPAAEERFEINHHGYRLTQSACYRESGGDLTCISCHNPHEKAESAAFRNSAASVCQSCHANPVHATPLDTGDTCIDCHMPTRRTQDVVEVTMTDHRISRGPFDLEGLRAPAEKHALEITDVEVFDFADPPVDEQDALYRSIAALRANRFLETAHRDLRQHLANRRYAEPIPYVDLAKAQIALGDFPAAETTARRLIDDHSDLAIVYSLLGTALLGQGKTAYAVAALNRALELEADPETHFNLAAAYLGRNDTESAARQIDRAIELRPLMAVAWKYRGLIRAAAGDAAGAESALRRALAIEPADASAYAELVPVLRRLGKDAEAERYLDVGLRVSHQPALLEGLRAR